MREPSQVFALLEHIYSSFDAIAKRRHVFKVETIGDCYGKLAADVNGLPAAHVEINVAHFVNSNRSCCYWFTGGPP